MSNTRQLLFAVVVIVIVIGLQLGSGMKRESFECLCGNRKEVVTTTLFFYPIAQKVENASAFPFPPQHEHGWSWTKSVKHAGVSLLINGAP